MKKIKVISCLITLGIMVLIFYFSSQDAADSSEVSEGIAQKLVNFVMSFSRLSAAAKLEMASAIHGFIRKAAHFTIYAALGTSAFISFKLIMQKNKTVIFCVTAVFCIMYAVSDEIHQISSFGRSCEIRDVLIDTAGAVTGMMFLLAAAAIIKFVVHRRRSVV